MKLGIAGCSGRMGRQLIKEILRTRDRYQLVAGNDRSGSPYLDKDLASLIGEPEIGITVANNMDVFKGCDAIIDFTQPEYTIELAQFCAKSGITHVIGTTGLAESHKKILIECSKSTTIVYASNMSIGVNILNALAEKTANLLDESYDIEIVEMHHNKKVDAPSGTALTLGEYAAKGRGTSLEKVACKSRDGQIGARPEGEIGFATLRGGDVVGDHTIIFAGQGERIEITHKATDRSIFAKGALRACSWSQNQPNGLYSMQDVLS